MARLDISAEEAPLCDGLAVVALPAPPWQGGDAGEAAALKARCQSALARAAAHGIRSVTFVSRSAEQGGYPPVLAATVLLRGTMDFLAEHSLPEQVRIVCRSEDEAAVYRQTYNLWYAETKDSRL